MYLDDSEDEEPAYFIHDGQAFHMDKCDLMSLDSSDPAVQQFKIFRWNLNLLGIRYCPLDSKLQICARFLFQMFMIGITGTTYLFCVWAVQALICQVFLTYSQLNLSVCRFFHTLKHNRIEDSGRYTKLQNNSIRYNTWRFCFFYWLTVVTLLFYVVIDVAGWTFEAVHQAYRKTFYFEELRFLRLTTAFYDITVWNIALHIYMCLTNIMYWETRKFNRKLKEHHFMKS
ncbi:unnamed protein product, partial [Mesorhabditis spiculigera]